MTYQDPSPGFGAGDSTTDVAKEQAGRVGQAASAAGGQVTQTTKEQAQNVVGEAKQQARDLVGEARTQVRDQAGTQRDRAVQGLHAFGDELDQMAAQGGQSGLATEVARQVSGRTRDLARYLEGREPADLLDELRSFARRRPMVFLAGAALAGVVAGRLTKGIAAGAPEQDGPRSLTAGYDSGQPYPGQYAAAAAPLYETPGYQAPGYEAPGYGGIGQESPEYSTPGGGFRTPDAGTTAYPPASDLDYPPASDPGYRPASDPAYPPAPDPAYQADPTLDPQQPPARGGTP